MTGTRWRAALAAVVPVVTASCLVGPAAPWGSPHVEVSLAGWSQGSVYTEADRLFTVVSFDGFCARADDVVTLDGVEFITSSGMEVVRAGYTDRRPTSGLQEGGWAEHDISTTDRMRRCSDTEQTLVMEVRRTGTGNVWSSGLRVHTVEAGTYEGQARSMFCPRTDGCTQQEFESVPEVDVD
ncbi:hypothetical protein [Janibacter alkaliphilus]|uniref:Lipoprotein n=1 Tax=Janibacter alkaliphilus TaxID=1069963 RepID=A0A852X7J7_9MICO|nr:hypothetical protein [Janibacter alkaliphilus]NYG38387.1 hypothetical protein [Janibacter alkaliphilus]